MYNMGVPQRQIARVMGVSPGSISGIIRRYDDQKSAKTQHRAGRPPKLSKRDKRALFRIIKQDPFITIPNLLLLSGLDVSERTILQYLQSEGIHHQHALRRPLLTPEVAQKRLEFAQEHVDELPEYWERWIFSDESTIARGDGDRGGWVFCRIGRRFLALFTTLY